VTIADAATGQLRFAVVPAAYVLLLRDGPDDVTEVLLQLRQGTGYMDGHWAAAAAGHVERGETATAAAHREAAEELGIDGLDLAFLTTMQRTGGSGDAIDERVDFFFSCRTWRGEPRILEPTKCADLRWCRLDALPDPVVPHEATVLAGLRTGDLAPLTAVGF
jgi:8-oxo-dGTP diphosphatase